MGAPEILKIPQAVQASFEPVMKVISAVRAQLSDIKDVVAITAGIQISAGRTAGAGDRCRRNARHRAGQSGGT